MRLVTVLAFLSSAPPSLRLGKASLPWRCASQRPQRKQQLQGRSFHLQRLPGRRHAPRRSPSAGEIRDQSPQLLWQDITLRIIGEPKLRGFLNSLRDRHMLPFYFHKKGFSCNGCRHFAWAILFTYGRSYMIANLSSFNSSEAVEAWKRDEYIMDRCIGTGSFFRDLIGVRSRVFLPIRSPARKETAAMRLAACGRRRTRSTGASSPLNSAPYHRVPLRGNGGCSKADTRGQFRPRVLAFPTLSDSFRVSLPADNNKKQFQARTFSTTFAPIFRRVPLLLYEYRAAYACHLWTGRGPGQAVDQPCAWEIPARCFAHGDPLQRACTNICLISDSG
jgi:hypothetical protein